MSLSLLERIWTAYDKPNPTQSIGADTGVGREQWERYRKFKPEQGPQDTKTPVQHKQSNGRWSMKKIEELIRSALEWINTKIKNEVSLWRK